MAKSITISGSADINYDGKPIISKAIHGKFSFHFSKTETQKLIKTIFAEAQRKYQRMHFYDVSKRFDKSWTGYIGEEVSKVVIKEQFHAEILKRKVNIDSYGYDGGDIHFLYNKKMNITNVSSRKLSGFDLIQNVVLSPQNYFVLIPTDQFNQYTSRCDLAFFVFILFDKNLIDNISIGDSNISVNLSGSWIIPGFLKSSDLINMKSNSFLYIKKNLFKSTHLL